MAMNYGKPSIKEELEAFKKQNINQLIRQKNGR